MTLTINGYLLKDDSNIIGVADSKEVSSWKVRSIPDTIMYAFDYRKTDKGLGGRYTYIKDVSMYIYYTESECSLEEAEASVVDKLYGTMEVDVRNVGYSEYTITGYNLEEFTIGGHNLSYELESHLGEYCWIVIEE